MEVALSPGNALLLSGSGALPPPPRDLAGLIASCTFARGGEEVSEKKAFSPLVLSASKARPEHRTDLGCRCSSAVEHVLSMLASGPGLSLQQSNMAAVVVMPVAVAVAVVLVAVAVVVIELGRQTIGKVLSVQ